MNIHARAPAHPIRGTAVLLACLLAGCHLVDQRDFDSRAGRPPVLPVAPGPIVFGPKPLLRIAYDTPDPDYAPPLADAVRRAMTVKPGVLFTVQTLVPVAPSPDAQAEALRAAAATGREIADAIVTDGADPGQIELAVKADPGVKVKEVLIFVH
jgi:hypothetical protein